ncbi:hypothetical protein ACIOHS_48100 [Streptomyces sp. NPDC088253]
MAVALRLSALSSSQAGTGLASRTTCHSATVMSKGYRRTRSGRSAAFQNW